MVVAPHIIGGSDQPTAGYVLIDDMQNERCPVDVTYRGRVYRVYYAPDRYTDPVHAQLQRFRQAPDFEPLNELLLSLLTDWEFYRVARDEQGQRLAADGSIFTGAPGQEPKIEKEPITLESIAARSCFLRMAITDAICDNVMGSLGNGTGTSSGTPPAESSAAQSGPAESTPGPSSGDQPAAPGVPEPTTGDTPALVTVPSLETRNTTG